MIRTARLGQRPSRRTISVLGWRADGTPIFSIAGGAGDDDDDDDAKGGSGDDDGDGDESDDDDDDRQSDDDDDDDDDDGEESPAELKRKVRKLSRENAKWRTKVRALEKKDGKGDKDKDDGEAEREHQATVQERDQLREDNVSLSVQLAVLMTPEASKFHDPEDVLRFLDVDDLTDEDGGVDRSAVADALEELAEKKPHLVRSQNDSGDDEDEEGGKGKKQQKSGRPANGRRKQNKGLTREALAAKYPALRR